GWRSARYRRTPPGAGESTGLKVRGRGRGHGAHLSGEPGGIAERRRTALLRSVRGASPRLGGLRQRAAGGTPVRGRGRLRRRPSGRRDRRGGGQGRSGGLRAGRGPLV